MFLPVQLFSARSDIFPVEFTEELSLLQDRVPAFPSEKAIAIVERQLGSPVSVLFRSFEERPIAAASLGQVQSLELWVSWLGICISGECTKEITSAGLSWVSGAKD